MSKDTSADELREQIAEAMGLEKGGITEHDSPANEHYYFFNEVMDYDTERIIMSQRINFEEKIEAVLALISNREKLARLERGIYELERLHHIPQMFGDWESVIDDRIDTLRKELDGGQ